MPRNTSHKYLKSSIRRKRKLSKLRRKHKLSNSRRFQKGGMQAMLRVLKRDKVSSLTRIDLDCMGILRRYSTGMDENNIPVVSVEGNSALYKYLFIEKVIEQVFLGDTSNKFQAPWLNPEGKHMSITVHDNGIGKTLKYEGYDILKDGEQLVINVRDSFPLLSNEGDKNVKFSFRPNDIGATVFTYKGEGEIISVTKNITKISVNLNDDFNAETEASNGRVYPDVRKDAIIKYLNESGYSIPKGSTNIFVYVDTDSVEYETVGAEPVFTSILPLSLVPPHL